MIGSIRSQTPTKLTEPLTGIASENPGAQSQGPHTYRENAGFIISHNEIGGKRRPSKCWRRLDAEIEDMEIGVVVPSLLYAPIWIAERNWFLADEGLRVRLHSFGSTDRVTESRFARASSP